MLEDYGLVGCHSARSNDLSIRANFDSTGCVRLRWQSIGEENEFSYAAIFEVKIGQKSERTLADLRGQTADTLFSDLVAIFIEGSDLSITEDSLVPSARCFQDTKKGKLVTRSNLQRLRCCVCHLHHEYTRSAPHRVRQFSKKYSTRTNTTGLMFLLEMPLRQLTGSSRGKKTKICTTPRLPSC